MPTDSFAHIIGSILVSIRGNSAYNDASLPGRQGDHATNPKSDVDVAHG